MNVVRYAAREVVEYGTMFSTIILALEIGTRQGLLPGTRQGSLTLPIVTDPRIL
jgi:hypothetical protein